MKARIREKQRWSTEGWLRVFELIAFDLDGTLVELNIPFDGIRKRLGIEQRFVLESIMAEKDEDKRDRMLAVLEEYELRSAMIAKPTFYAQELLKALDGRVIKGVITRNCRRSAELIAKKYGFSFDFIISREDCEPKPSPEPLKIALAKFNVKPSKALMVGDFLFDILAGKAAGAKTALIITEKNIEMAKSFIQHADYVFKSLKELAEFLGVVE